MLTSFNKNKIISQINMNMGSKFLKKESEDGAKAMSFHQLWMLAASDMTDLFFLSY